MIKSECLWGLEDPEAHRRLIPSSRAHSTWQSQDLNPGVLITSQYTEEGEWPAKIALPRQGKEAEKAGWKGAGAGLRREALKKDPMSKMVSGGEGVPSELAAVPLERKRGQRGHKVEKSSLGGRQPN